jgi:hypothetical protein
MLKDRSKIATILIGCVVFIPFLNQIPQKWSVRSELVRCCRWLSSLRKKNACAWQKYGNSHRACVDILLFPQLLWWLVARMLYTIT